MIILIVATAATTTTTTTTLVIGTASQRHDAITCQDLEVCVCKRALGQGLPPLNAPCISTSLSVVHLPVMSSS